MDMTSLTIHYDGLEVLLKSKFQELVGDPFILNLILWYVTTTAILLRWVYLIISSMDRTDVFCAIATDYKPRFQYVLQASSDIDHEDLEPPSLLGLRYKIKLSNLTGLQDQSQEAVDIWRMLRHLVAKEQRMEESTTTNFTEAKPKCIKSPDQLVYRVLALYQRPATQSLNHNAVIFTLFGYAALAHIVMFSRNVPPWFYLQVDTGPRERVLQKLKRMGIMVETIDLRAFQIAYPEMMLWIIMMGGLTTVGMEAQGRYAALLAEACYAAGVTGTTELAISLAEFLWTDLYLDTTYKRFWDAVGMLWNAVAASHGVARSWT
jgi:hypothetical protein